MLIGAHVSVAGGFVNGITYAEEVGAECIQFFAKSPRQWRGPALDPAGAQAFRAALAESPVERSYSHTAYLLNLSTTDEGLYAKSIVALGDELERAAILGVDGLVTHIGNAPDGDARAAADRAATAIRSAYAVAGEPVADVRLLLENTAGGGSSFGCTFSQLAEVIELSGMGTETLGVCLDTCHGFAFGMPLDTEQGWREVVSEIASTVGFGRLGLIHANDCMFERGSKRDRHEWIGRGFIGDDGFEAMLCVPEIAHVPTVMEMPGEKPEKDVTNLLHMKALRDECGKSQ